MKKRLTIIACFLAILMLVSCGKRRVKITSEGILSEEELTDVLYDIHIYDATIATYNTLHKTKYESSIGNYDSLVFAKHDCNDSIFRKSVEEYTLAGRIKDIYNNVIDSLNKTSTVLEKKAKEKNQTNK